MKVRKGIFAKKRTGREVTTHKITRLPRPVHLSTRALERVLGMLRPRSEETFLLSLLGTSTHPLSKRADLSFFRVSRSISSDDGEVELLWNLLDLDDLLSTILGEEHSCVGIVSSGGSCRRGVREVVWERESRRRERKGREREGQLRADQGLEETLERKVGRDREDRRICRREG